MQYAYTTGTLGTVQQIVSYAYGDADWKDKLTRFNGVDIAYDAIGNPIQDGVWTYTWENGRQLRRMACDATIAEFVYNADGLRVQKTVNGITTNYTLHGKNIVHLTKGNAELHFWYDAQNRPAIVEFNGAKYGYLYNLQGDVIGLIDGANNEVVKYTYDAWGKPLSVTGSLANTIGYYNPFRYRGYVYDVETGLYYLRSRYYNPSWGRFVNADVLALSKQVGALQEHNLYAYCMNNPVNMQDSIGDWPKWLENTVKAISAVVVVAAVVATIVTVSAFTAGTGSAAAVYGASIALGAALSGVNGGVANEAKGNSYMNGYIGGAVGGAIQGACSTTIAKTIVSGTIGVALGTTITDVLNTWDPDSASLTADEIVNDALTSAVKAAVTSTVTGYMGYAADLAATDGAGGLMPTFTIGFRECYKAFWGWADDAMVYLLE